MKKVVKAEWFVVLAAAFVTASAAPGWTQARGMGRAVAVAPARASGARIVRRLATPTSPNFAPLNGAPGLGFDYPHLAAVGRVQRDRFGHGRRVGVITPFYFGGDYPGYFPDDYDYEGAPYDYQQQQQPPFILQPPQNVPYQPSNEPAVNPAPPAPPAPVPEVGQLILVRRDGQVVLAVAFTTAGGRLTYITRDGTRRSFPIAELDKEATLQMNDANGTTVALPD